MSKHEGFALYCKVMMTYMMVMIKAMRFEEDLYDGEKDRDDDDEYAKGEEEDKNENVENVDEKDEDDYEKGEEADVWREGMSALQWLSMVACQANPCPFFNLD